VRDWLKAGKPIQLLIPVKTKHLFQDMLEADAGFESYEEHSCLPMLN